ncbi:hypothetical protein R6Q59_007304 [Mikania micrantha]
MTSTSTPLQSPSSTTSLASIMASPPASSLDRKRMQPPLPPMAATRFGLETVGKGVAVASVSDCVTNTLIEKVEGFPTSYLIQEGLMKAFKANVDVEKSQLPKCARRLKMIMKGKKMSLKPCVKIFIVSDKTWNL